MITLALVACAMIEATPQDPIVLFNGKNLEGWIAEGVCQYVKDGKPYPVWSVKDGKIVCTGKGFRLSALRSAGVFRLPLSRRVSHGPRVQ